jgi:hypothetical protein
MVLIINNLIRRGREGSRGSWVTDVAFYFYTTQTAMRPEEEAAGASAEAKDY